MENESSYNLQIEILNKLLSGGSLNDVLQVVRSELNHDILVTDTNYSVLASSSPVIAVKSRVKLTLLQSDQTRSSCLIEEVKAGEAEKSLKQEGMIISLVVSAQKLGYFIILQTDMYNDIPDHHLTLLEKYIAPVIALQLAKQEEVLAAQRKYKDAFLFDLLYGNMETVQDIVSQGEIWGWNLRQPHQVVVFELENYEQFSPDRTLTDLLWEIVQGELSEEKKTISLHKNEEVILILPTKGRTRKEQKNYVLMLVNRILTRVNEMLAPRSALVGVGREYDSPLEIFRSFQEAKVALKLGRLKSYKEKEKENIPFFKELGLTRILYNHDKQELAEFYWETLGELDHYALAQNSELMDTLEKYLTYRGDLKETAQALFLHPNTLRYRLKKIEEILDVNLEELDTKLSLLTAFKIKYLIKL